MSAIIKPREELDFLTRVDDLWRLGETQEAIAQIEGLSGASALRGKCHRLGFDLERKGGPRLVTTFDRRSLSDLVEAGVIIPAAASETAGAL